MKKLFLFLVLGLLSFTTFSQLHWFPMGAEWYYNNEEGDGNQGYIHYKVIKDTIVDSQSSKILRRQDVSSKGKVYNTNDFVVYEENSKVSYYENNMLVLLYDFSLNVGDTLKWLNNVNASPAIIDSIMTIEINGETLKVQYASRTLLDELCEGLKFNIVFIEKIGSFDDFINYPSFGCGDIFYSPYLRCYEDNSIYFRNISWDLNHNNAACDTLIIQTGITDNNGNKKIEVYPNPTNEFVNFKCSDIVKVEVFDIYGKKVKVFKGQNISVINIKQLTAGYYIIRITIKNNNSYISKIKKN